MKKFIALLLLVVGAAQAQTFPVNNLTVAGTSSFFGQSTFTLSPTGPTPSPGDSTTKMATTAFVQSTVIGLPYAPILSPNFVGTPTAPTQSFGDNSTSLATDAFVQRALGSYNFIESVTPPSTLTVADTGRLVNINGSGYVTLPSAAALPAGSAIHFYAYAAGGGIATQGGQTIVTASGSFSLWNLNTGDEVSVISNGTNWYLEKSKHQGCANIMEYGGNNQGTAFNGTAFTNALNAQISSSSKCIYFPAGTFAFNTGISYSANNSSITIRGEGPSVTTLYFPNGNTTGGLTLFSSNGSMTAHIRDLSFSTGGAGGGTAAILASTGGTGGPTPQEQSDITNVTIRGNDGYSATDYWSFGLSILQWSQWNFTNVFVSGGSSFSGVGASISSTNPPNGIVYNFQGCTFNFLATGLQIGNNIQGVTVNQGNFNSNTGISVPAGEVGLDQLTVTASQFGITNVGTGVSVQSLTPNLQLVGNLFIVPANSNGVALSNTGIWSLVGNSFNEGTGSATRNGITVSNSSGGPGLITGNIFDGMVLGSGVLLNSTSNNVNVQSNVYSGNGTNVTNSCTVGCTVGGGSQ